MASLKRTARATWRSGLQDGQGRMETESGVLKGASYSFSTRFENEPGTNPEELIAAAHAGCFSMALADTAEGRGYPPTEVSTEATCTLTSKAGGGWEISKMSLVTQASIPNADESTFESIMAAAKLGCPVSNLLRSGLDIEYEAELVG